jgi:predicted ABC-type transport system involved in lysophospholipase L1 biosynthesis ATPase subunit
MNRRHFMAGSLALAGQQKFLHSLGNLALAAEESAPPQEKPALAAPQTPAGRQNALDRGGRLLERVGLGARRDHRPGQLSGGERQRAAVVRALINQPQLLLADEPTGALDRAASEGLSRLLLELNTEEKVTLILVTHAPELAGRMRRRCRLLDGRLEPQG